MKLLTSSPPIPEQETWFRLLFERSADAILLFDPVQSVFVDCNQAAMDMMLASDRHQLLQVGPGDLAPEMQPDGSPSYERAERDTRIALEMGTNRFEWLGRRLNGELFPVEVLLTVIQGGDHPLIAATCRDITQNKAQEEALRRSEEQFRSMFERSADAMTLFDPATGRFVASNRASNIALGGSPQAVIEGLSPQDIAPEFQPDGRPTADVTREVVEAVIKNGSHRYEWSMRRLDGSVTLLELVTTAVQIGERIQLLTVARNIEERKRMEADILQLNASLEQRIAERTKELRRSEERFRRVYEGSRLGICVVHWDGRYVEANPAYCDMLGYPREELIGKNLHEFTAPECLEADLAALELVRQTGFIGQYEKTYVRKDGARIAVVLNGLVVKPTDGGEEELWAFTEEITQRRQAEQTLRASEQNYRALFEASSQGVMINDERGYLMVNEAAARMFHCRPEDFIGKHPRDTSPPFQPDGKESHVEADRIIRQCLTEGEKRFEWLACRMDGSDLPLEVVLTRIEMDGRPVLQAMVTDISERKRAEAELKRALEHERELSQLKSNFVSMVSHEFRTPLGIIQSSAEILDDYLDDLEPAERREQLHSITKNSRRMAGLMEEVLVLGRLDAGRMQFQPAPLDLAALCRRLVDEVLSTTDAQCPIEYFTTGLPDEAQGDERLLRHILLNLLTNAVKYSEPGQRVVLRACVCESCLEFVVEDRGIGMPAEEQDRLFEAFHRGSNVDQRPGTGLGLVIVKRCVELHGGTIHFQSSLGAGTTVRVLLPLTVAPLPS